MLRRSKFKAPEYPPVAFDYEVVYSDRKTIAIQVKLDGSVILRAPKSCPWNVLERFLMEKADWVEHQRDLMAQRRRKNAANALAPFTDAEKKELRRAAAAYFQETCSRYAGLMGVTFGRISIREQKTRWGSCSAEGNLNFNWRLMLAPESVREYVAVHELAHRRQMNHSAAFYREIRRVMPDYEKRRAWLKNYGITLWAR